MNVQTVNESPVRTAFAYLDISDPLVAWLAYRGEMVSSQAGDWPAVSSWLASYLLGVDLGATSARTRLEAETRLD